MYNKLDSIGFVINDKKSILKPTQRIMFFGFILDSVLFMLFLPQQKVEKIAGMASFFVVSGKDKN